MTKKKVPTGAGLISGLAASVGIRAPAQRSDEGANGASAGYIKPPSRTGRVGILTYHDPAVAQQLKMLSAEKGIKQQQLMAEALNMLFAKYGKGQIA